MVCVILSIEDDGIAQSVRRGNREERGGEPRKSTLDTYAIRLRGFGIHVLTFSIGKRNVRVR